jgi:hypothetical protein
MVVVNRDRAGRVSDVDVYEAGTPPPDWVADYLPHEVRTRSVQTKDPRTEVKAESSEEEPVVKHTGGGWYELPSGAKVQGQDAVREAGFKVPETE